MRRCLTLRSAIWGEASSVIIAAAREKRESQPYLPVSIAGEDTHVKVGGKRGGISNVQRGISKVKRKQLVLWDLLVEGRVVFFLD